MTFFNLRDDKGCRGGGGGGGGEFDVHYDPLWFSGAPLVGLAREGMEKTFDTSQVTRCKNWQRADKAFLR